MKKYICLVFNNIDTITVLFEPDEVQTVAPKQLSKTLKYAGKELVRAVYAEYYCIWDTGLKPEENFFLLEREIKKISAVTDYDWILEFLLREVEKYQEPITKAFGSTKEYKKFIKEKLREIPNYPVGDE